MIEIPHLRQPLASIFEIPAAETRLRVVEEIELRHRDGSLAIYGTRPGKIEPKPIPTTYDINWIGPENTTDYAPCAELPSDLRSAWLSPGILRRDSRDRYDRLFVARSDWEQILKLVCPEVNEAPPAGIEGMLAPIADPPLVDDTAFAAETSVTEARVNGAVCAAMAQSPLTKSPLPSTSILIGFLKYFSELSGEIGEKYLGEAALDVFRVRIPRDSRLRPAIVQAGLKRERGRPPKARHLT